MAFDVQPLHEDELDASPLAGAVDADFVWLVRNPLERTGWIATEGRAPTAACATFVLRTWIGAKEERFVQRHPKGLVVDSAAGEPAEAQKALADALVEQGRSRADLAHFAWPTDDEWRFGAFERFDIVRTQTWLGRDVGSGSADLPEGVERPERFDHEARWLWDRCAGSFGASTIRDEAFLNWRLLDRPGKACRILSVRGDDGVLGGFAAVRESDVFGEPATVIVDWLVPTEEAGHGELLRQAVLADARAAGSSLVGTMLVEWSPWFDAFQRWGFTVRPSSLFPIARSYARRFDHLWLRDHWWMTLADTTLV